MPRAGIVLLVPAGSCISLQLLAMAGHRAGRGLGTGGSQLGRHPGCPGFTTTRGAHSAPLGTRFQAQFWERIWGLTDVCTGSSAPEAIGARAQHSQVGAEMGWAFLLMWKGLMADKLPPHRGGAI